LLDNEGLEAEEISVQSPQLTIYQTPKAEKSAATNTKPFPILLDALHLDDIGIQYLDTLKGTSYALDQVNLHFKGIDHDGSFQLDQVLQNTERVDLNGAGLEIPLNEYYSIQTGPYAYASEGESFSITDVHLIPQYSKIEYSDKLETQTDWFDAEVTEVSLKGLDLVEILQDSMVQLEQVHLNGTDLFIYRDKHLPFPDDQIGALPPEQILSIPYPIAIDTIFFKGHVAYEEQPDDFEETGLITFDNIDAQILNFTNTNIEPSTMMHLLASGQIVEQGRFNVEARFELDRPDQRFSFRGTVNDLPMDSLNQMLGPVARVNIKSGMAEEIDFQFMANDTLATGEMVFLYKDLKLQVLNAKKHETNLGSGLMSFFANTFVIRSRNPRFLFPRKGKIYFKRDTSKAVFNYWGKSILSGAVSSVGIHKSDRQQKKDSKAARK